MTKKFKYYLYFENLKIGVVSTFRLDEFRDFCKSNILFNSIEIELNNIEESLNHTIYIKKSAKPKVEYIEKDIYLEYDFKNSEDYSIIIYAILPIIEYINHKKGIITLHAAAVYHEDYGGILILGKTGSGKTTTVLKLCRKYGFRLIGNDLVKVNLRSKNLYAESGSKYFYLREKSIRRSYPELINLFNRNKDPWLNKIYISANDLNIDVERKVIQLERFLIIHIDEKQKDKFISKLSEVDYKLFLNENLSRYIRGSCLSLFDTQNKIIGYIPSFDNKLFFEMRRNIIEFINERYFYISGNSDDITSYLLTLKK